MGTTNMYSYICYHRRKQVEVTARTTYQAQFKAAELLKISPKRQHEIAVKLTGSMHTA